MEKILVIDDNEEIRKQLKWGLGKEYSVLLAGNGREALDLFKRYHPRVVALDLGLPPIDNGTGEGFRCLDEMLKDAPATKVIVITGNDQRENAMKAIQMGAYDFYHKPIALKELLVIIARAFYLYNIEAENRRLHISLDEKATELGGMVGQCPEMLKIFSTIRKIASSDISVLVIGESGTGKELVARAVHSISLRKDSPFVPINCGAIPENLLESELFGHEKGAFTGAHLQVQGKVEYAHKGTIFLDEIGELPANLQVKLLRFLQEKTIQRVGGREDVPVDARIIAATNVDIQKAIQEGRFREDLFYRIGVLIVHLPPLRKRGDDILFLSNLFLRRFSDEFRKRIRGFSPSSIRLLESYEWPGNVRELENRIQRAVIMSEYSVIEPHDLGFTEKSSSPKMAYPELTNLREARDRVERDMAIAAIEKHEGNIARAAEDLGISRPTLYDIMKKHGLCSSAEMQ
ncbi:MAG: PEP-CTERM-box response regulator transcription factor [Nitrospirales bacterium]|nr:PEP-CTERM-box response regulator transcription factor [Nitrospirales bacterium]